MNDPQPTHSLTLIVPLSAGQAEAWRRQCQTLLTARRPAYEAARRRLGLRLERAWLVESAQGEMAVVYLEAAAPLVVAAVLLAADDGGYGLPLASSLRDQLLITLHDLAGPQPAPLLAWPPDRTESI